MLIHYNNIYIIFHDIPVPFIALLSLIFGIKTANIPLKRYFETKIKAIS